MEKQTLIDAGHTFMEVFGGRGGKELLRFALAMRERLDDPRNAAKGPWRPNGRSVEPGTSLDRLDEEVRELRHVITDEVEYGGFRGEILHEAADVAVFAMICADEMGAL
jgi:hypothetical protein